MREREAEEGAGSSAIAGGTEGGWPQALAPRSRSHGIEEGPGGSAAVARGGRRRRGPRAGASSTRDGAGMRRHACVYMISGISSSLPRTEGAMVAPSNRQW